MEGSMNTEALIALAKLRIEQAKTLNQYFYFQNILRKLKASQTNK
jgi:hypothetical protein